MLTMPRSSNTLCRTCRKSSNNIFPLTYTTTDHEDIDFATMLLACTSVSIYSKDALPQAICEECVMKLIAAYIFKLQCEKSDRLLRADLKRKTLERKTDAEIDRKSRKKKKREIEVKQSEKMQRANNDNYKKCSSIENKCVGENGIKVEKTEMVEWRGNSKKIEFVEIMENKPVKSENDNSREEKGLPIENKSTDKSEVKAVKDEIVEKRCMSSEKNDTLIENKLIKADDVEIIESVVKIEIDDKDEDIVPPMENKLIEKSEVKSIKEEPIECDDKALIDIDVKPETDEVWDDISKDIVIRKKYKRKPKKYTCLICAKELTSSYGLAYHMKAHDNSKNLICPIKGCDSKFLWEPALKRHMLKHSDKKEYLCEICGKAYNSADSLRYHMDRHKGQRPHLCTYCGKTFTQTVHLTYHMNVHTKSKKFACSKCNRTYLGPIQLRKHWRLYCGIGKDPPRERKYKKKQL